MAKSTFVAEVTFKVAFQHRVLEEGWNTLFFRGREGKNIEVNGNGRYSLSIFNN